MTRKICPTCNGKGIIPNPKDSWYYLLNNIECPNCGGEGFIGMPDNLFIRKPPYTTQSIEVQKK